MADRRISELSAIAAVASADVLPIVDTSLSETNKVSVEDLLRSAPAGTAAAPSIAFVDDPDTGFYRSATNELSISTAGTQRVVIDSSGNVGIGTDAPSTVIHVAANDPQFLLQRTGSYSTSTGPLIQFQGRGPNAINYNFGKIQAVSSGSNNAGVLQFFTNSAGSQSERMRIDADGNVGIGTTSPGEKLEVNGTIKATDINFTGLATYADDTAAGTGGLVAGDVYKTSTGELRIKL